jgi:hypothetical protein
VLLIGVFPLPGPPQRLLYMSALTCTASAAFAAVTLMLLIALNVAFVVNRGVCCADDSSFAVVAKNLARGEGYSLSLGLNSPEFSLRRFHPEVGTGPALILPVSLAIWVFGNQFWVPGMVQVALWTLLLVIAWWTLGSIASPGHAAVTGGVFLFVVYAVSPYHFEQWYAMLGEVPAALAVLIGIAVWASQPYSSMKLSVAAMCLSLAFLTKAVTMLYAATFFAAVLADRISVPGWSERRGWAPLLCSFSLGFVPPILAFELWKVSSLGPTGYLEQVRLLCQFIFSQGVSSAAVSLAEITNRLLTFHTRFAASLASLLVLALFGASLSWQAGSPAFRRLYLVLLAGVLLHSLYWLVLSPGWPRYMYISVVLICALVVLPFAVLERPGLILLYVAALALALLGTLSRVQKPIADLGGRWFTPSETRSNQEKVVSLLDAHLDRRPFVGQWWAPVADLEYLSKGVLDFTGYAALSPEALRRRFLLVTNSRFDNVDDRRFMSLVLSCGTPILSAPPYAVYECGAVTRAP